ncbi:MAG: sulfotransferase [Phycisphaerales bacterium]|nr:sulfotransferase [Phycisphaerales bacterium]
MSPPKGSLLDVVSLFGVSRANRIARQRLREFYINVAPWYASDDLCNDPAVFIGGCGRSGTTLLREMLNRHPAIACGPETAFLCDLINPRRIAVEWELDPSRVERMAKDAPSLISFCERFFRAHAEREKKPRWADKTPRNVRALPKILSAFPYGKFIHCVRDGRDVACSLRNHPRETVRHGKVVAARVNRPIRNGAMRWFHDTSAGMAFLAHPRCLEVRYERLVTDTEAVLREVCTFIEEPFDERMLVATGTLSDASLRLMNNRNADQHVQQSSLSRWRRDMTLNERHDFHAVAGELLIALGYAKDATWIHEQATDVGRD